MKPWDAIIPQHEQEAYRAAGFGRRTGLGSRPALLIIDVQYRTVGTEPRPFFDAIKEFPTACGQIGWDAVHQIARVLALFRAKGWPVLYPYVSQKETFDKGRLADKVPALMTVAKARLRLCRRSGPRAKRCASTEKASERVLRYATCELSDRARASIRWWSPAAPPAAACAGP